MEDETPGHTEGGETARRALRLIDAVVTAGEPIGLNDLVDRIGLSKSTCYRLLRVLQEERYLDRGEAGGYTVGSRLVGVAAAVLPQAALYQAARPVLRALADSAGETSTLHVRSGHHAVLVLGAESTAQVLRRAATIGETTPLTRGAAGRAILASLSAAEAASATAHLTDATSVLSGLDEIRQDGFVLSFGANHPGVAGIAAPVTGGAHGMSVAVAGPAERWTEQRMRDFAPKLVAACEQLAGLFT
ncbi:hypothetical protein GCM10027258_49600 [Amycolatopsis stemonae]